MFQITADAHPGMSGPIGVDSIEFKDTPIARLTIHHKLNKIKIIKKYIKIEK